MVERKMVIAEALTEKFSHRLWKIKNVLTKLGEPKYQLKNTYLAIYQRRIFEWSKLSNLKKPVRDALRDAFGGDDDVLTVKLERDQNASQCTKSLLKLHDGNCIEAVWMNFTDSHNSLCLSSQVGCTLKCGFCATGAAGFKRQMTTDEIVDQVFYHRKTGREVHNVSFMGMGEPFLNPRTFDALNILTDVQLVGITKRKINVSTVGIIPAIERMSEEYPEVNLSFSLHTPFNDQRSDLIPANKRYPLEDVMCVLNEHALANKRKIMLAYLLLPGYNDSMDHAKMLVQLIQKQSRSVRHLFHVNMIRYNPAQGVETDFERSSREVLDQFMTYLRKNFVSCTLRQSFGVDIDAACGQLYNIYKDKPPAALSDSSDISDVVYGSEKGSETVKQTVKSSA